MQLATKPITTATKLTTLQQWAKRTRTASEDCLSDVVWATDGAAA